MKDATTEEKKAEAEERVDEVRKIVMAVVRAHLTKLLTPAGQEHIREKKPFTTFYVDPEGDAAAVIGANVKKAALTPKKPTSAVKQQEQKKASASSASASHGKDEEGFASDDAPSFAGASSKYSGGGADSGFAWDREDYLDSEGYSGDFVFPERSGASELDFEDLAAGEIGEDEEEHAVAKQSGSKRKRGEKKEEGKGEGKGEKKGSKEQKEHVLRVKEHLLKQSKFSSSIRAHGTSDSDTSPEASPSKVSYRRQQLSLQSFAAFISSSNYKVYFCFLSLYLQVDTSAGRRGRLDGQVQKFAEAQATRSEHAQNAIARTLAEGNKETAKVLAALLGKNSNAVSATAKYKAAIEEAKLYGDMVNWPAGFEENLAKLRAASAAE